VDELNAIQDRWMKLDPHAPKAVKDEVFSLMKRYPEGYLSVSKDLKTANAMIAQSPMWANKRPIGDALKWLLNYKPHSVGLIRTDVAWCGELGRWVDISSVMPS